MELHLKNQILEDNAQGYVAEIKIINEKMDEMYVINAEMGKIYVH